MSGLGHIFEELGISTLVIGLIPQHVEGIRPPRALLVPFDLGRPFGGPNNADVQRTTLDAALDLLDRPGPAPILETLEIEAPAPDSEVLEGWACPIPLPTPPSATNESASPADAVLEEARLLKPWFDKAEQTRGHSTFGLTGLDLEGTIAWLTGLLDEPNPAASPVEALSIGDAMKLASEDLKTFYIEAATAQPRAEDPRAVEDWFWQETAAGALLKRLATALKDHEDGAMKLYARLTLVPERARVRA